MPRFHPLLAAYLRAHHGVVAAADLADLGVTPDALRALLEAGELVAVFDGVYRHAIWPATFESACAALCATHPSVVICCGGAAQLWQYRGCTKVGLHVTTTRSGKPARAGMHVHRCRTMPAEHVHDRGDGIRVTTPARTIFDLARHVGWQTLESVIEQGIRREQFDIPALYAVGRIMCRRGRAGSALFGAVLRSRPMWRRPVDSHPELVLRDALAAAGLVLECQVQLQLPDHTTIHPDLGDPACGFFIEIDDHEWHGGRLDARYDARRDRQVRLLGCRIERVSTDDITPLRPGLVPELREAHRQQQRQHELGHVGGAEAR
jgi:hypothetical protein